MNFKHLVGKSTLKEGITIHKNFESFFESPEVGNKREITIIYSDNRSTKVTLRKLNNVRQHVHIKYASKVNIPFVNWLNEVFVATRSGTVGEFLEFRQVSSDIYQLIPITKENTVNAGLYIADSMQHQPSNIDYENRALDELKSVVSSIMFQVDEGQIYYNRELERKFVEYGWDKEGRAIPELDLKYDFRKDGVQVEVEFGNARSYYQDYIKFMLSYHSKQINLGVLITPTFDFANVLCEIGKQKALLRGKKTYSGMMHFEKAHREFHYLKDIFNMPIVIVGIDINSFSEGL